MLIFNVVRSMNLRFTYLLNYLHDTVDAEMQKLTYSAVSNACGVVHVKTTFKNIHKNVKDVLHLWGRCSE